MRKFCGGVATGILGYSFCPAKEVTDNRESDLFGILKRNLCHSLHSLSVFLWRPFERMQKL